MPTAFAALFSLLATMLRVASGHHGFRLSRLWVDRVVVTLALAAATAGVALSEPGEPGVVGHQPRAGGGPGPDVLVARTADAVVMNISRRRTPRARVLHPSTGPAVAPAGPHLRVVDGGEPPG